LEHGVITRSLVVTKMIVQHLLSRLPTTKAVEVHWTKTQNWTNIIKLCASVFERLQAWLTSVPIKEMGDGITGHFGDDFTGHKTQPTVS